MRSLLNSYEFLSWMCKMWVKIIVLKPIYYRKYAENAGGWELSSVWSKNHNRLSEKCHLKERNGKCFLNLFLPHSLHPSPKPKWTIKEVLFQTEVVFLFSAPPYDSPEKPNGVRRVVLSWTSLCSCSHVPYPWSPQPFLPAEQQTQSLFNMPT